MKSGSIAVIQMKDLTSDNLVNCEELARVDMERPKEHHLVAVGDLIFRSRGLTSSSALLQEYPGDAVLAAPLLRIRVTSDAVLPEYLNWYISQRPAQSYLASCAEGTALKMISKQSLECLEVLAPPIRKQQTIVEIAKMATEEQRILTDLAKKRGQHLSVKLLQLAEGG
jgi:hypothetical protein